MGSTRGERQWDPFVMQSSDEAVAATAARLEVACLLDAGDLDVGQASKRFKSLYTDTLLNNAAVKMMASHSNTIPVPDTPRSAAAQNNVERENLKPKP